MNNTSHTIFLMTMLIIAMLPTGMNAQTRNNEVFFSTLSPSNSFQVIYHSSTSASLVLRHTEGNQVIPMEQFSGLEGWWSSTATMPSYQYIGFAGETALPLYWDNASTPPANFYTPITTDPTGDNLFNLNNLDIISSSMTYSADKLYFSIQNNGGGFPTGSGFTFYSYMPIIANPEADPESNPIVFGLMYTTNVAGIISPGLYKISGTGFTDLQYLAPIVTSIDASNNRLYLSCNVSDLTSDTDFMSWYDVNNPNIVTMMITSKITLTGGTQESDRTQSNNVLLQPIQINSINNYEPVLALQSFDYNTDMISLMASYSDADHNLPWVAEVQIDNQTPTALTPMLPLDFTGTVSYGVSNIAVPSSWIQATIRFSDDAINFQTLEILHNSANSDYETPALTPGYSIYPNPCNEYVSIQAKESRELPQAVSIYNIKGQLLYRHELSKAEALPLKIHLGSVFASGVYIVKIESPQHSMTKRFLKVSHK